VRRIELPNNTPEQVREYVTQAKELADELAPEGSQAWAAVFRAAYDGFAGKQVMIEQPQAVDLGSILNSGRR
jgi:hypothetical protein